jgi:diaminohydroxyphosphoribosylaminopyrimidine deaminase/5-amino-6-(5-phosphoribosylamino)uracil reductase
VVASADAPSANVRRLERAGVVVVRAGSLEEGLGQLRGAGISSLLVEGGGRLAGALLARGLLDRFYWVQSPLWLGEQGVPAFTDVPSDPIARVERWTAVDRRALGDDTLLVLDHR